LLVARASAVSNPGASDVEQSQPTLLAQGESDHAPQFHQFRLGKMVVHALPERVVSVEVPDDRLGISKSRFLTFVVSV
jgi:hypothetical protein